MLDDVSHVNPDSIDVIRKKVKLFRHNPDDTRLDNHDLHGTMVDKWAFSITDDIRIVYEWIGTNMVRFLAIGPHATVYPKSMLY